ncbi:hypothetical protein [Streptomyces sp. MA5143a]|uniref:hypothetical protein n=1 Tax=Streptomyces sp. MA5143a TaxID=2083010 RepID=UPI000D2707FC|nr:hypothetical protein [Streptomyces sp. MA5143a]SPF05479.1 hypothetical protein SMA5143A_6293 [Streptomyces sp. MA5143a]
MPRDCAGGLAHTQKTAVELGPAGELRATRNLTTTLERPRADRQPGDALTHGADPLHLALAFGIEEKTAIRYADSVRALLGEARFAQPGDEIMDR